MNSQIIYKLLIINIIFIFITLLPGLARSQEDVFVHRAPKDTVQWITADDGVLTPPLHENQIEGPGERLGLIGPIIATGGKGKKEFIAVYDPAGVLVGIISKKEAKKNPQKFIGLVRLAQLRAEMQNTHALMSLRHRALERKNGHAEKK